MTPARRRLLERWLPPAAFLLVALLALGGGVFDGSLILSAPGEDLDGYYTGMRAFGFSQLRQGNLPLWNPLLFSGMPYFGNFESALLYPPNWLHLVLPLARAVNLLIGLHLALAGWLAYLWRRRAGNGPVGAFIAGLCWMLSGPFFLHIYPGHLSNISVMAWMPLLFLTLDGWLETGAARWWLAGTAVVSVQILAGHPQYVYYGALGAALYVLMRAYGRPRAAVLAAGGAAMYAGAALLCAVQLLTGFECVAEMSRSSGTQYEFAKTFALAPENLATLLVPGVFGDIVGMPYHGRWHLWEGCLFIGVTGLFLAVHGALAPGRGGRRVELWMAAVAVFLALGAHTPLYEFLYAYLPGYGLFRGAAKFIFLSALFLAALAGDGYERLARREDWPAASTAAALVLGVLFTAAWAWTRVGADLGQHAAWRALFEALSGTEQSFFPQRQFHSLAAVSDALTHAGAGFLACGRAFLLAALALYLMGTDRRWVHAFAALALLEMTAFARPYAVRFRPDAHYPPAWREAAARQEGDFRVLHIGVSGRNPAMAYGTQDAWGYGPLYMSRYAKLMEYVWRLTPGKGNTTDPRELIKRNPILGLLRIRLILLYDPWLSVLTREAAPRLLLLDRWTLITDAKKAFDTLMDPSFDARRAAILESAPDPAPVAGPGAPGRAAVLRSSTDWLEIDAELSRPALLLVTDDYSRLWRVRPLAPSAQSRYEVVPADYALRGVPLAAGRHHLLMEYRPRGFYVGRWVSLAAALAFAAAAFAVRRRT